ncbi:MAG TPA: helix-turn-helix transcriptional regulator [Chloroflexia bacterium]|jgi:transcriptional regulator with XRE-family HTH domain|nr:helix-turn-helix transcriptional regulator [Chloroflexia bacterium]
MSLSDYIKYLRAVKGGVTPWEIAEASGVPASEVHLIEVKHRRVGEDDEILSKLAGYFGVPLEDLTARRESYRKMLTQFLEDSKRKESQVTLTLESGEAVSGKIDWFSREAVALVPAGGRATEAGEATAADPYIVQRGWVASWQGEEQAE